MQDKYFDVVMLIERLHRLFLDVVKAELDQLKVVDISNVQAMILYNIGKNKLTVGEISNRGYYLGSNVTYNLKKLVENGYIAQEQSPHDRRSSTVKLSKKGLVIFDQIDKMLKKHLENLPRNNISDEQLQALHKTMQNLENFWSFLATRTIKY